MKIYKNEDDTIRVGCVERDGEYVIIIEKYFKRLVATKGSKKRIRKMITHITKKFSKIKLMLTTTSWELRKIIRH